jgi:hypothetical protein
VVLDKLILGKLLPGASATPAGRGIAAIVLLCSSWFAMNVRMHQHSRTDSL